MPELPAAADANRRPSLLFLAPILPAETGNGLAMRAGLFLDAFSRDFVVTLLVVPVVGESESRIPRFVAERAGRVVVLSLEGKLDPLWDLSSRLRDPHARASAYVAYPRPALCRYATTPALGEAAESVGKESFDAVHVMRSYLAPYAGPFLSTNAFARPPYTSIDLDDDEAATHRRLAALLQLLGSSQGARIEAAEASKYERHESQWMPRFRLVVTCTAAHAGQIAAAYPGCRTAVVPNTVVLPPIPDRRPVSHGRILFVGNLSYLPNVEGIRSFVHDVFPGLRAIFGELATIRVAGSAPVPEVRALASLPGVEVVENPKSLTPHYAWANLVVIPLSAGGGTRIKLIEAFAYGVPVVATRIGAEGVAVEDDVHLLLADSQTELVEACVRLLSDDALAARLSFNARRLVEANYSRDVGVRVIRNTFEKIAAPQT